MARLKCNVCGFEMEGDPAMPPFKCQSCNALGKGFSPLSDSAAPAQPSEPPQQPAPPRLKPSKAEPSELPKQPAPPRLKPSKAEPSEPPKQPAPPRLKPSKAEPSEPPKQPAPPRLKPSKTQPVAKSDRIRWRYPAAPTDGVSHPMRSCPAVDPAGRVFAAVGNKLAMFLEDDNRHRRQWEYSMGGVIYGSPVVGPDGNVRVHSSNGYLHTVDTSGERVGEPVAVGEPLGYASPAVDQENNTWISAYAGGLIKVDAAGRTSQRRFFRTRQKFDCPGLIHNGVYYVGCMNHYVYAVKLDGDRGQSLWDHSQGQGQTGWYVNAAPALVDGSTLIVASSDEHLYAFSLDGQRIWRTRMPGMMLASPVVDRDNTIFVGISQSRRGRDNRGMLVSVDPVSHQVKWQREVDAPVESTPVIGDDGVVYFGDNDGNVHAVDQEGLPRWVESLGVPVRSAGTILANGQVAFGLDDGTLVVLRCSSTSLRAEAWPKFRGTLQQTGVAAA